MTVVKQIGTRKRPECLVSISRLSMFHRRMQFFHVMFSKYFLGLYPNNIRYTSGNFLTYSNTCAAAPPDSSTHVFYILCKRG
jgi:hypothetical protein